MEIFHESRFHGMRKASKIKIPVALIKVLMEHNLSIIYLHTAYGCFCMAMKELNSSRKDLQSLKYYSWVLFSDTVCWPPV